MSEADVRTLAEKGVEPVLTMPWSRTQTEFEMEDEEVFQPSGFATVSDPRNGQPGAVIPESLEVPVSHGRHPPWTGCRRPRPNIKIALTDVSRERR